VSAADSNAVSDYFEAGFLEPTSVREQAATCDDYYLADLFREVIPAHQPVLEAGCGSGKWVAWAAFNGWKAIGLDWSEALVSKATEEVPEATFLQGDMRDMPLERASVGSIISLGAVEHSIEGPEASLREYGRVLRPGGQAVITVPFLGPLRRIIWPVRRMIVESSLLRRALNRPRGQRRLRRAEHPTRRGWTADFLATQDGWTFYQYQLAKPTMRQLLRDAGFEIDQEFVFGPEEGLVQTLGRPAGQYAAEGVVLSPIGRLLRRALPRGTYEHMLAYVVHKPEHRG
jgi:SAM-dependent methyltransferase